MTKRPEDYETLKAKWYAKLKKSGFDDIEQEDGRLKSWSTEILNPNRATIVAAETAEYYRRAGYFLHHHPFRNEFEKAVWELHSEGQSIRTIAETLKKRGFKTYRRIVHETLKPLVQAMLSSKDYE